MGGNDALFPNLILKPIPRMENTQIVNILHIALLEVQQRGVLLGQEMQGV